MNELENISKAIKSSADARNEERIRLNQERGPAHYFVPDSDPANQELGMGIGYWVIGNSVVCHRKMANGYEMYPIGIYDIEWLRRLVQLWDMRQ